MFSNTAVDFNLTIFCYFEGKMYSSLNLSFLAFSFLFGIHSCKQDNIQHAGPKEVIIVGGGLAGMAAARELINVGNFNVKVFEARKDRYGGRIWTRRSIGEKVRGAEAELGGMLINTRIKDNPLLKLAKEFELPTKSAGSIQVHFPEKSLVYSGDDAISLYTEAFKILLTAVDKAKNENKDISIKDAVESEWEGFVGNSSQIDRDSVQAILKTLPFPCTQNFSALLYNYELDFGWDSIVVDGLDSLVDRIVAGHGTQKPVKVELNKVVRNIKVDNNRKKVLVRTTDRKQAEADRVIVTVPSGVLKKKDLIFDPPLSKDWYHAINNLGRYKTEKVIVGFDKVFWPEDVGSFSVFSSNAKEGFLQMWTNMYRLTGAPYLVGSVFGEIATVYGKMGDKELRLKVTLILGELFGEETLKNNKIKFISRSKWAEDKFTLGAVAYPKVGSNSELWKTLQKPFCPYIYFAGAYTQSRGHFESLHDAFNSGVQAAKQIISNVCKDKEEKKAKKKNKKSKDEL